MHLLRSGLRDVDHEVRYQVAFTLGTWGGASKNATLAAIAKRDGGDPWMRVALLSSLADGAGAVAAALLGDDGVRADGPLGDLLRDLAGVSAATGDRDDVRALVVALEGLPAESAATRDALAGELLAGARESDDPASVREGQSIAIVGFPIAGALGFSLVTHRGIVSSITSIALPMPTAQQLNERTASRLRRGSFEIYQLDATAYPGNSGGPVVDAETGQVVGVINMVLVKGTREAALSSPSGIAYAVPVRFVHELLAQR